MCALLALFIVYLEFTRQSPRGRLLRLLFSALAVLALWLLAFRPAYSVQTEVSKAILLTANASPAQTDSLLLAHPTITQRFSLPGAPLPPGFSRLPGVTALEGYAPGEIYIVGQGLSTWELAQFPKSRIHFLTVPVQGVQFVSWSSQISVSESLVVQGTFQKTDTARRWLYLRLAGQVLDSVLISNQFSETFELRTVVKDTGRFLFDLEVKGVTHEITGKIPVEIQPSQSLRILVLLSAPDAEMRFLKDALAKKQHRIALRTRISKDKYKFEYLNQKEFPLQSVSASLPGNTDLLLIDLETLLSLGNSEKINLKKAIESGLGMLLLPDSRDLAQVSLPGLFDFSFQKEKETELSLSEVHLPNHKKQQSSKLLALPFRLTDKKTGFSRLQLLAADDFGLGLAGYRQYGQGRQGITLLPQTYQWMLEGEEKMYTDYWSEILSTLARPQPTGRQWQTGLLPFTNAPVSLELQTDVAAPTGIVAAPGKNIQDSVFLRQHPREFYRWSGTYWPYRAGWHRVRQTGDSDAWQYFYVFDPQTDWLTIQEAQKQHTTREWISSLPPASSIVPPVTEQREIPLYFFAVLLLVALSGLWLTEKIFRP